MASTSKYVRGARFTGSGDAAKLQMELGRLSAAGYRVPVSFVGSADLRPARLNDLAQKISRAIGKRVTTRFDGSNTPDSLNALFAEVERILS